MWVDLSILWLRTLVDWFIAEKRHKEQGNRGGSDSEDSDRPKKKKANGAAAKKGKGRR